METDVTQENLSFAEENTFEEGDKKMSAAAKKFQKLVANPMSATDVSAHQQERRTGTQLDAIDTESDQGNSEKIKKNKKKKKKGPSRTGSTETAKETKVKGFLHFTKKTSAQRSC